MNTEFSQTQTIKITALLLLLSALLQTIYTTLSLARPDFDVNFLWGVESVLFVVLVAFAGSALVTCKNHTLGFSAITFSALLNSIQIGIGYTQFGAFQSTAEVNPEWSEVTFSVISLSFFLYNAAKILIGLAAIIFGSVEAKNGNKLLGKITILGGIAAFVANIGLLVLGLKGGLPSPLAGGSGVFATFLLSLCVLRSSSTNRFD